MEVSLVNNASLTFKNDGGGNGDYFSLPQNALGSTSIKVKHVTGLHTNQKFQNKLNSLLSVGSTADTAIICAMRIGKENSATAEDELQIKWGSRGANSFFRTLPPLIVNRAGLQMRMELQLTDSNNYQKVSQVIPLNNMVHREILSFVLMRFGPAPVTLINKWKNQNGQIGTVSGRFTLNLVFDERFLVNYFHENAPMDHCRSILAKMLENESEGDTVINGQDGKTVKCHRAVLIASCPYFQAMFQSGMWESTTNEVNMTDMTEVEIRAFLGYLYTWDVKPALENIQTAWKLLKAGNYYQLDELISVMREVMMLRANERYSVDLALEMLLFAKNVCRDCTTGGEPEKESDQVLREGVWNDLSLKAVQILKWYSKERPLELMASEKYKKLYEETPQLAMEVHAKFLQYLDTDEMEKSGVNGAKNFMVL